MRNFYLIISDVSVAGLSKITKFRRSFKSEAKSDSKVGMAIIEGGNRIGYNIEENCFLGSKDRELIRTKLVPNGDSHAKLNRFIQVYHTVKAPRRFWVDFDTYRIGRREGINPDDIEMMSDSTMHCIHKGKVDRSDFTDRVNKGQVDFLNDMISDYSKLVQAKVSKEILDEQFLTIKDNLPEGFLQERDLMINYQALRHIYFDRCNHRQPEFPAYCNWIKTLPYAEDLILAQRS